MNLSIFQRIWLECTVYDHPNLIVQKVLHRGVKWFFSLIQQIICQDQSVILLLISDHLTITENKEIKKRIQYYLPAEVNVNLKKTDTLSIKEIVSSVPVIVFGERSRSISNLIKYRPGTFDIDYRINPMDGWAWSQLSAFLDPEKLDIKNSREKLVKKIKMLQTNPKNRCYVFGTGPSLEKAINLDWEDGYVIVCNTIVRDPVLWGHLNPDFIVAGDAIYHFGNTRFAQAFRSDLRERLRETDTLFIYPAQFHSLIRRELKGFESQLVPIPSTWKRRVDVDLTRSFALPNLGNVLGLLLLPLACTLADNIYLWGFDGRNPNDKLFWSNSKKHSYPEYMDDLIKAHPRFFEYYIPSNNLNKYVMAVQGDQLDGCLRLAENRGKIFVMMHPSWTPTLQKRFCGEK
jgi:hypothetical protein